MKQYSLTFLTFLVLFIGIGGKAGAVQRCPTCRGTGMQVRIQQLGPGMMQQIQTMCGECQGQGERIDPKLRCKKCNGRKVNRERKILEVQIDKGMEDGQKITFGGEGDQVQYCITLKPVYKMVIKWGL